MDMNGTKPSILVIGFPKAGTSTITKALSESGFACSHWKHKKSVLLPREEIGRLIYDGWFDHGDPFHFFEGIDALTEVDFTAAKTPGFGSRLKRALWKVGLVARRPRFKVYEDTPIRAYWPQLDLALLLKIKSLYPGCRFILNSRDPDRQVDSIVRWSNFPDRLNAADLPGLPRGRGLERSDLRKWVVNHFDAVRHVFGNDPNFLEFSVEDDDARERLGAFVGREIAWWGVANKNMRRPAEADAIDA